MVFPIGRPAEKEASLTPGVAAVIVAYRSGSHLPSCLAALDGKVDEAVVIDNTPGESPAPDLQARFPWVDWINNESNLGFAAAANQGVLATKASNVLLLNPDSELIDGLAELVAECAAKNVAGAGGLLTDRDGSAQVGFFSRSLPTPTALIFEALGINRVWKRNPVNVRYRLLDIRTDVASDVQQPAGAFLLLRRDALNTVGGLDERFHPAWFEDVDLCKRLRDAGFRLRFAPAAMARHTGGHAVATLPLQERLLAWYGGLLRYAEKHFSRGCFRCVRSAVLVGLVLRALHSSAWARSSVEARTYWNTARQVRSGFPDLSGLP